MLRAPFPVCSSIALVLREFSSLGVWEFALLETGPPESGPYLGKHFASLRYTGCLCICFTQHSDMGLNRHINQVVSVYVVNSRQAFLVPVCPVWSALWGLVILGSRILGV